jgi:hypothetical protein
MFLRMRSPMLFVVVVLTCACGDRNRAPAHEVRTQGTSLNLNGTALSPTVHINPQDGGGTNIQIGAARVNLPGENARPGMETQEGN